MAIAIERVGCETAYEGLTHCSGHALGYKLPVDAIVTVIEKGNNVNREVSCPLIDSEGKCKAKSDKDSIRLNCIFKKSH